MATPVLKNVDQAFNSQARHAPELTPDNIRRLALAYYEFAKALRVCFNDNEQAMAELEHEGLQRFQHILIDSSKELLEAAVTGVLAVGIGTAGKV